MQIDIGDSNPILYGFNYLLTRIPYLLNLTIYIVAIYALIVFIKCCKLYINNNSSNLRFRG